MVAIVIPRNDLMQFKSASSRKRLPAKSGPWSYTVPVSEDSFI
jgi:hypothetical protein